MLRNDKFIFDYLQPILQVLALKLTARDWRGLGELSDSVHILMQSRARSRPMK